MENPADPLAQLRDIHVPLEPHLWPPAPGWWLLAGALLVALWYGIRFLSRHRDSRRPVRVFINRLNRISLDPGQPTGQALYEMSALVRRFSIHRYGRKRVAALQGQDWLDFLDSTMGSGNRFSDGIGKVLGDRMYRRDLDVSLEELRTFLIDWAKGAN